MELQVGERRGDRSVPEPPAQDVYRDAVGQDVTGEAVAEGVGGDLPVGVQGAGLDRPVDGDLYPAPDRAARHVEEPRLRGAARARPRRTRRTGLRSFRRQSPICRSTASETRRPVRHMTIMTSRAGLVRSGVQERLDLLGGDVLRECPIFP